MSFTELTLTTAQLVTTLFDERTFEEMIELLITADDDYNNGVEAELTDEQYDLIRRKAELIQPHHVYFTGVGSAIRGGKIKLPFPMGSLNQKFEGDVPEWIINNDLLESRFLITDKLDGVSAMVIYPGDNKPFQIGYSRGDGTEGADISRHVSRIVPDSIDYPTSVAIRGEIILAKTSFEYLQPLVMSRAGKPYRNARNMVAGLMNSKTIDPIIYEHLAFVAYQIVGIHNGKYEMLQSLAALGFLTPKWTVFYGKELQDSILIEYLTSRKLTTEYEIDGIVIDVDDVYDRMRLNPSTDTLNPEYAFKYKITDEDNYAETVVTLVEHRLSKHGYIKPRIHVAPVELVGVTVTHANGLHAKYISDNKIRVGTKVAISRMGDVVPNIVKVLGQSDEISDLEFHLSLATDFDEFGEWDWTETDVDVKLISTDGNKTVAIKQMLDFFDKIDAAYLGAGNLEKLYDAGFHSTESIILSSESSLKTVIGANGTKIYNGLRKSLTDIPIYKLVGANSTQRGIGVRKIRKLELALGDQMLKNPSVNAFELVSGFDTITATSAVEAIKEFNQFFPLISDVVTTVSSEQMISVLPVSQVAGLKICFTGFRDKELQTRVEAVGGTIQSSVSSKTDIVVTSDVTGTGSKLKKARSLNKQILAIPDFINLLNE